MTRLKINVNQADKTLSCEGVVAVGEDIELVVDPGGNISDYDQLRVRFRFMNEDVAVFPLDYDIDEWTKVTTLDSAVYKGIMTLNTEQLLFCFSELPERATMTFDVVVDQLPDDDGTDDVPTLFGRGRIKIRNWSPNMNITDVQEGVRPVSLLEIADRKIDKVTGATPGHLPVFNADGGLESSGVSLESLKGKVARSDFTNVQEISVNTIKNVAGKANEILAILKGTAGAVALALFALAAHGVPFEEVLPTTAVDTNTVGIAHERIEGAITAAAGIGGTVSNIVTKSYVEDLGIESGTDGGAVSNIVTNVVTKAFVEDLGIEAGTDGETVTNIVNSLEKFVTPYMWPGDWFIRIVGAIPGAPAGTYLMPTNDMLARMTGASGVWRSYKLFAEPDPVAAYYGDPVPPVTFDYRDPSGAVAAFTNDTLVSSGTPGVVHVAAIDTNGVVREAAVVMTPVRAGHVANLYAAETNVTERYVWATNLLSKLATVSVAEADLVNNNYCRSFADRYEHWKYSTWKSARQLSRFGSDGRIHTNEWAGAMIDSSTWADLATPTTARAWAFKQNRDFFWPDLQTNLWCFSSACHEGHAAPPALGKDSNGNAINGYRSAPLMAVAPHYAVGAAHYGDWVLSPWQCHPRFVKSTNDNDYVFSHIGGAVGTVTYASGNDSDIRLYRLQQTVPDQCIAHFATREVLQSLSPTLFKHSPCLTVNAHQVVTPYCLGSLGSTLYGWSAEPRTSTFKSPYPDGITIPSQAADCVHMGHMYDSGDFFFLAAPNGRVVPIGQTKYLNDGGGISGPSYLDAGILESLSAMIRSDSNGMEDIRFWTAADLYAGGVTNLVEVTP